MTEPVSRQQAQQQDGGDDPVTDEEAVAALRDGTVRIGCVRGMAFEDVPPSALIAIARTALAAGPPSAGGEACGASAVLAVGAVGWPAVPAPRRKPDDRTGRQTATGRAAPALAVAVPAVTAAVSRWRAGPRRRPVMTMATRWQPVAQAGPTLGVHNRRSAGRKCQPSVLRWSRVDRRAPARRAGRAAGRRIGPSGDQRRGVDRRTARRTPPQHQPRQLRAGRVHRRRFLRAPRAVRHPPGPGRARRAPQPRRERMT